RREEIAMAEDDVARFVAALKADKQLQAEVKASSGDLAGLVAIAASRGYAVTREAVEAYLRARQGTVKDEELEAIVGGFFKRPVAFNFSGGFGTSGIS